MNLFLPGIVSDIDNIDPGTLVLINTPDGFHAGIIVDNGNNGKSVIDFEGKDQYRERFMAYQAHGFGSEPVLSLSRSRIVPDLSADSIALGQHEAGPASKALYLSQLGPIVNAGYDRSTYRINLQTGSIVQTDLAYVLHAKRWRIEVEDGTGNFEVLREIVA